jgi:hypothetical protein
MPSVFRVPRYAVTTAAEMARWRHVDRAKLILDHGSADEQA